MKKGAKHSEETKKKLRDINLGRKFSKESREKMSKSSMGKKGTYGHLGKKHSATTKLKISQSKKGTRHSLETRQKMRKSSLKGKDNPCWKGGITEKNKKIRNSFEMKLWREEVFKRDNYTCVWCGALGSKRYLNADHIKPFSRFPDLRFDVNNGRTMCVPCHSKTDSYKGKVIKNYKLT